MILLEGSRVYTLEYLPSARKDMIEIIDYINKKLNNPTAAERLAVEFIESAEKLLNFPYSNPVYMPIRPLNLEYRKLLIKNYIMFYWVNVEKKLITISRIIYCKRNHKSLLQ